MIFFGLLLGGAAGALRGQNTEDFERSMFEADALLERAKQTRNDAECEDLVRESLAKSESIGYIGGKVRATLMLGDVCDRTNRTEEALDHYLRAEEQLRYNSQIQNPALLAATQRKLGDLFFQEKLYVNARRYYRDILEKSPQNNDVFEKIADTYLYETRYDSALTTYKELATRFKDNNNLPRLVQVYQKLANTYEITGPPGKSLHYYRLIEDLIERNGSPAEKALLYSNMGKQYALLNEYKDALKYFRKSELQCSYTPCDYPEVLYANLGIALHNTGNTAEGVEYLKKARRIVIDQKDTMARANLEHLIAGVYLNNLEYYNALSTNQTAMKLAGQTKQYELLAATYRTAAEVYQDLYEFENAFEYYQKYLQLMDSLRRDDLVRLQRLNQKQNQLSAAEGQLKYLMSRDQIKELEKEKLKSDNLKLSRENELAELRFRTEADRAALLQKQQELDKAELREKEQKLQFAKTEATLAFEQLRAAQQTREIETLRSQEAQRLSDSIQSAQEFALLQQQKENADLKLRQEGNFRSFMYGIGVLGLIILALITAGYLFARRNNKQLSQQNQKIQLQNEQIEAERMKSDRLLLNILPQEVADELKARGYATPRLFESATILFTDFTNFTSLSTTLTPEQLIDELNDCFFAFDEICEKHGLEKIKTIGDAFMCAGGLPVPNETHPIDAVHAALEMFGWLEKRNATNPKAIFRDMRIGIHIGPVIGGVVGKNKFAFDIWGDAVNLASRLEELGEPGRVNISGTAYEVVKHRFRCEYRGKKEVHNKGLVDMYFIVDAIPVPVS